MKQIALVVANTEERYIIFIEDIFVYIAIVVFIIFLYVM